MVEFKKYTLSSVCDRLSSGKSIKSVEVDQENGTFTITDIKDNVQTYTFTDIEDISLVDGQLTISYKNKPAD